MTTLKKTIALLLALTSLTAATGCTEQEIIDNTAALLSGAEILLEENVTDSIDFSENAQTETLQTDAIVTETFVKTDAVIETKTTVTQPETTQATTYVQTKPVYTTAAETFDTEVTIDKDGVYTSKEDVALYIYIYEELPQNFITKKEAQELGWSGGSLEPYAPGMCIGGNRFGNYEGLLPEEKGRTYTECDIDTLGAKSRGAKRIVFSNDGLIYYTDDHYESFELLYGEE